MSASLQQFRTQAREAIGDPQLQSALLGATDRFLTAREKALSELIDAEALRDQLKSIRAATLARLAFHLENFERNAQTAGAQVHWARNGGEAAGIVTDIARSHGVTLAVKSKSMTTEEIHLNQALSAAGVTPVETDLGEWIIQLAGETPSHIIAPAIHKTRQQVAELFAAETGRPLPSDDIPVLTAEARHTLREKFLAADMGISGVNLAVAETGSVVLVTNEGNGRLVTSAPRVHVAIMGIEKVTPTWDEAAVWLALLARSSTGQPLSIYTSVITGPRRAEDPDGPDEVHIILLDNGRSHQLGTPMEEALQCIRCGACLNACPVYKTAGGHAYGSPYSGPIGSIITPPLMGLEAFAGLPHASSLCGACLEVCPARIDIPRMLLELRSQEVSERLLPWWDRLGEQGAAYILGRPRLLRFTIRMLRLLQRPFARNGEIRLPAWMDPTGGRRLPALPARSFHEIWASGELEQPKERVSDERA